MRRKLILSVSFAGLFSLLAWAGTVTPFGLYLMEKLNYSSYGPLEDGRSDTNSLSPAKTGTDDFATGQIDPFTPHQDGAPLLPGSANPSTVRLLTPSFGSGPPASGDNAAHNEIVLDITSTDVGTSASKSGLIKFALMDNQDDTQPAPVPEINGLGGWSTCPGTNSSACQYNRTSSYGYPLPISLSELEAPPFALLTDDPAPTAQVPVPQTPIAQDPITQELGPTPAPIELPGPKTSLLILLGCALIIYGRAQRAVLIKMENSSPE